MAPTVQNTLQWVAAQKKYVYGNEGDSYLGEWSSSNKIYFLSDNSVILTIVVVGFITGSKSIGIILWTATEDRVKTQVKYWMCSVDAKK